MNEFTSTEELYKVFLDSNQSISTDTRNLKGGSIFFALKGANFNGNNFAVKAIEEGCSWAIVDEPEFAAFKNVLLVKDTLKALQDLSKFHREKLNIPVIGITGSNGKTTNKELIHAVLSKKYNTYATLGNLNNHIGVPLTLLSITSEHEMAIVEMGANHQGEIAELSSIAQPDFGLITNIGKAHLEGFGGEEGVKKGKGELFNYIRKTNGKVFVNCDDPVLMELSEGIGKYSYGEKCSADVHGEFHSNSEFVEFKWSVKGKSLNDAPLVKTQMFGHYNFINLLCAACIGNYFDVPQEDINLALQTYHPEMNRSQMVRTEKNTVILDAYNANPSSMQLAIDNFSKQLLSDKIVILGDMFELGDYSEQEHLKVLNQLNALGNIKPILVGEHFFSLQNQFTNFRFFRSTSEVITFLKDEKISSSNILIKGSRGMKLEKVVDFL
jgi:UDP-N-acetylmuramoyl-tripeptide--D-alanyl-D-alanine ligase